MKVFISWSGELSRELGEAFRDWLPSVIQNVKPFFTPNDIEKGARWNKDIAKELEESSVGIFCLTHENLEKPWMLFEAGALSKNVDTSHVCPILFGIDNADIEGPLVQFQSALFNENEIKKLIQTINSTLGDNKLDDSVLYDVFEMWWPKLKEKVDNILEIHNGCKDEPPGRPDREIIEEILELSRLSASYNHTSSEKEFNPNGLKNVINVIRVSINSLKRADHPTRIISTLYDSIFPLQHVIKQLNISEKQRDVLYTSIDFHDSSLEKEESLNRNEPDYNK